mmetsp:Transcript_54811/g.82968  ORF Transcript_54811/g.82968 Transcript_54811/m.82968 type:complete len:306 (-) Transcript_54811:118-1035(-)
MNSVNLSILQPTPIDEEKKLRVVRELPLLSETLLAQEQDLGFMLQPLQDEHLRDTHPMTVSPPSSDWGRASLETQKGEHDVSSDQSPSVIPARPNPLGTEEREALSQMLRPLQDEYSSMETVCATRATATSDGVSQSSNYETVSKCQYHYDPWKDRHKELLAYIEEHGDCNVPYHYASNPKLSQWIKRQRHHYRLKERGEYSNLVDERQALLDAAGFVWDSRASNWEDRFDELKAFQEKFGHVRVSIKDRAYRNLAVWLKRQRNYARKLMAGDRSTAMTDRQLNQLLRLGVSLNTHLAKKCDGSG